MQLPACDVHHRRTGLLAGHVEARSKIIALDTNPAELVLSRCQLINVFWVGTDASSSNGTDLSCQCIKLASKRQLDAALQQELTFTDH